jgi:hypothetical protein
MSLYANLLGPDFAALPAALACMHARRGAQRYFGEVSVLRGTSAVARLFAACARLPPAYAGAIEVDIVADADVEQWTRRFGTSALRSRIHARDGLLRERLGLACFDFRLSVAQQTIHWNVSAASVLGLRLPVRWFTGVTAAESIREARYQFDVRAELPGIGLLVHYSGWLDPRLSDGSNSDG